MRWVGIDEAGYGPNLGPLVMTAVVAEGPDDCVLDLWNDLAATVSRAGRDDGRLWVDDSKAILKAGKGRDRLNAGCLAALCASGKTVPGSFLELLEGVRAGSFADVEVERWVEEPPAWPGPETHVIAERCRAAASLLGAPWRVVDVHTVVVGPERFNEGLCASGSKAKVHFEAFSQLLEAVWERASDGMTTRVRSDKHGGRHFYLEPLSGLFTDAWIDRGPEGPLLSQYTVRGDGRRLELSLLPRADAEDGLVALASIVSKAIRESWMDVFNAYWLARIPDLRPTAGYPTDALRFRKAIEPSCEAAGLTPHQWWRLK
ncbi:hypothetical protein [Singulisphaera sp. PoT]|uniref:hypothetical protein n=1 Tax=Singulisphaera sp. PoT TaxID=3411797 RepID=UPI003BF5DDCE